MEQTYKPSDAYGVVSVIREMCLEVMNLAYKGMGMGMVKKDLLEELIPEPNTEG